MPLTDAEQRVCAAVSARRAALVEDLRLHVGLPTGGGNASGLARSRELLAARARRLGASVEVKTGDPRPVWLYGEPGYGGRGADMPKAAGVPGAETGSAAVAVCRRERVGGEDRRPVLVCGHLDTVHDPLGPFQKLTIAPDGRTATGPGCADMKGGLVIGMGALEALEECGVRLPWTLVLNSDEETGSYRSRRTIFEEAARVAAAGGVGVALEPAGARGELIVERAGSGQFFIEAHGRAAHVGRDFRSGVSAVNALAGLIVRIAALGRSDEGLIVNIGPIDGGTATNVVPDRARAWGNVRFPDRAAAKRFEEDLRAAAGSVVGPGLSVEVAIDLSRQAKPRTVGVDRLASIAQTVSEQLGRELPLGATAGVCDGNVMQSAGLATLDTLGVRGGGLHTTDEWIEMDSLVERCQLLALFLMRATG